MSEIYNERAYRDFSENLRTVLNGKNIKRYSMRKHRSLAVKTGTQTVFGSWGWRSAVSSRIGPKTVYLGSPDVRLPKLSPLQKGIISNAPDQLHKVLQLMRTMPFIHVRRQMGNNPDFNPICNLYMSTADPKNFRTAYMWANTLAKPAGRPGPEFTMIHIPEEHPIRQQVLSIPEHNINIALGSDYMGEDKKGFLRQAMWTADRKGMLGLHAGTKVVYVKDSVSGKLKTFGVLLFGLSATGKSTWSCHQLGLNHKEGERTEASQDDIVFLRPDGSTYGSEQGFFVKTDVDVKLQEAMYYALIDKTALYENVMIDYKGNPDFLDERLNANGRAVIQKSKVRIKIGNKLVPIEAPSINLPPIEELDGLVFAFITRRNTIMPFAQKLTLDQAALAYLWGESTHSFASEPVKAGESVRTVGTDPFIIGSRGFKVNRFYEILKGLESRYPEKLHFCQYNTGGMGEILETIEKDGIKKKNMIRKTTRVPIELMAAIQRGDLRGTNKYRKSPFGTDEVYQSKGGDLSNFDINRFYSKEQIDNYVREIVAGRKKFTDEITAEGLNSDIIKEAESSYNISPDTKTRAVSPGIPKQKSKEEKMIIDTSPPRSMFSDVSSINRPPRSFRGR
ncbi:MAG: phosphoenolpyruvate carboxykinase (ATP) [candidate division Zixibacteria bacterium]